MALPSTTPTDFPIGLDVVTIGVVDYIQESNDLASQATRNIVRTDENGDYAESQTRASAEPITGTMTLQRATTTTVLPSAGEEFSLDYDRSGTASTLRVTDVKVARGKDAADMFEIGVLLVTYQG
jgi:hypothetical protein